MILQPQHQHDSTPTGSPPPSPSQIDHQTPFPFPSPTPTKELSTPPPQILTQMLNNSFLLLGQKGSHDIKQKMKYCEQKVHLSYANGPNQYLSHLATKKQNQIESTIKEMIDIKNWLAADNISKGITKMQQKVQIKTIKNEITNKLIQMKKSIMSLSSLEKRANSQIENLLEFKKKGYWMHENTNQLKAKNFLTKMKRIQSEQKKRHEKELVKHQYEVQVSIEKQKKAKEEARKLIFAKELEKQMQWRQERLKNTQQEKKRKEQIQTLLQKFHNHKPYHIKRQQQYIKNVLQPLEQQRQKRLQQIKTSHQPFDQQELDQHLVRYQQYKDSLMQQRRKKDQEEQDINTKLEQQLKELYHGKFHQDIQPRFYNSVKVGQKEVRKKIKEYQQSVLDNFKPVIDPRKREKVQQHIIDLQLKQDKTKRKVVQEDGSVVIQEKLQYDPKKIGLMYLQRLKEQHEGKPYKKQDRSVSMMELSQSPRLKRIDYLRQNKPNLILKKTLSEWKKIVSDNSYSPRQKYQSIMQQAVVFQQKARQKEREFRSYKKGQKALQLKFQMDKYYMQSVNAKMVVLKDVILKQ